MAAQIYQFRNRILAEVPGCPVPRIDREIEISIRQMCEDTYAYTKSFEIEDFDYTTIDTSDNDSITITLSDYFTSADPIAVLKLQLDGVDWYARKLVLENDNSNLTTIEISGTKFFNFPALTTMKLFPFTSKAENFDIFLKLAVKPSRNLTSYDDEFRWNDDWFEGIISLSSAHLQQIPNRPWSDGMRALENMATYRSCIANVKIDDALGGSYGSTFVEGGYF